MTRWSHPRTIDRNGKVHIAARIPVELADRFEEIARRSDRSISAELRRLIRLHVEREGTDA